MILALSIVPVSVVIYFGVTLILIASEAPPAQPENRGGSVGFSEVIDADYSAMPDPLACATRNGTRLPYRLYEGGEERLIVLVHGSAWHGMQFHPMATCAGSERDGNRCRARPSRSREHTGAARRHRLHRCHHRPGRDRTHPNLDRRLRPPRLDAEELRLRRVIL